MKSATPDKAKARVRTSKGIKTNDDSVKKTPKIEVESKKDNDTAVEKNDDKQTIASKDADSIVSPTIPEKKASNALVILGLVILWYSSAILCVTTSKNIMMIKKLPNMLCTTQFLTASLMCIILQLITGQSKSLKSEFTSLVVMISLSYTFGFIFTNFAISIVSPSFVETIKAAEPLFSVVLGFFFFQEGTRFTTYLTLLPICGGVAIACTGNASYSLLGLLASAASNVGFASRSVFSKRLNKLYPGVLDEVSLFKHISNIGVLVLIPLTLALEKNDVQETLIAQHESATLSEYIQLLAINGAAYSVYNLASFAVLAKSDLITHAVLNAFRRVVSISFTVMYFGTVISRTNAIGIAIAVAGVLAFGFAKAQESKGLSKPKQQ